MKILDRLAEFAAEYEKHCGEPPTATIIDSFSHAMETATKQGKKYAQQNLPMDNDSKFQMFGNIGFPDMPAMADVAARILKDCYMEGYEQRTNKGKMEVCA